MNKVSPMVGTMADYPVYKISANDTNKFALICDSERQPVPFMMCVEIFDVGGATPPNEHSAAYEHFYVLSGVGKAQVGEDEFDLGAGAHLLIPPQTNHLVRNTGSKRLYVLTTMVPDERFSALIRSGIPAELDEEDRAVLLGHVPSFTPQFQNQS